MDFSTLSAIGRYATPEVFTVVGGLTAAWIGWKVTAKGLGLVSSIAQKASFLGLAAAVLFVGGLGSIGLGTGEMITRMPAKQAVAQNPGMFDSNLLALAKDAKDPSTANMILEYARQRDGVGQNEDYRLLVSMAKNQIEKSNGNVDDQENQQKILLALIELAKSRPQNETMSLQKRSESMTANFAGYSKTNYDGSPVIEDKKESIVPIPFSMSLVGIGFGLTICGIVCNQRRKKELGIV